MSPMQIGLLVMGALVIIAVVGYNRWTTYRNAPRRSAVRMTDAPSDETASQASGTDDDLERREPVLDLPLPTHASGSSDDALDPARLSQIDPLIDAVAPLALDQVVSGDAVLAALPVTRRVGTKPFSVEGLNIQTEGWEAPRAGQRYKALQASVQLANRMGPLNEIEYSEFVVKVHAFADALGATPDLPEMMQEVARARELDQFAGDHDAQLGFTVIALRASWSPGYIAQHASRLGFLPGSLPGRMVLPASEVGGAPILVLQFETRAALADDPEQNALREFNLTLDVPLVSRHEHPFERMRQTAQALAVDMEGLVTDGGGNRLNDEALDTIAQDLEKLYDVLDERELSAGSVLARRLFS